MEILGIPIWLFVTMMATSLILGLGIRWWLDRRDARRLLEEKERIKELKKENKRNRRKAKKAVKSGKMKSAAGAPDLPESTSTEKSPLDND